MIVRSLRGNRDSILNRGKQVRFVKEINFKPKTGWNKSTKILAAVHVTADADTEIGLHPEFFRNQFQIYGSIAFQ